MATREVDRPARIAGYSEGRFWRKLGRFSRVAGRVVIERALRLYYAAQDPTTPDWAKRMIYAALAYFIVPFDLVPDVIPGIGYFDDLGTLLMTLLGVSTYVSPAVKQKAREKMVEWFGP